MSQYKDKSNLSFAKRLNRFVRNHSSQAFLEIYNNVMIKWDAFTTGEYDRVYDAITDFMICPALLKSTEDGEGLIINKRHSQLFTIAGLPHADPTGVGIRKSADPSAILKIFDIANENKIDTTYTQILYAMSHEQQNNETNKELIHLDWIRNVELRLKKIASRWIQYQEEDIEEFSKKNFDGTGRTMKQLGLVRIDSENMEDVQYHSDHMQQILRGHGFNTEVPYGSQMRALKASIMSNEWMPDWCTKVMSDTAAAMWPGRNPLKLLDDSGFLIGYLNGGIPLYLDLENKNYDNKHFAVFGGSGKGKSTLFLYWLWNAIAAKINFIHIVPKQDHGTSHLNMIKAIKGQLAYVGTQEFSPNPYMIVWDPATHGDSIHDMKLAYNVFRVSIRNFWHMIIGHEFSNAMQAVFKKTLTVLYQEKGFIDENSMPINCGKWLNPVESPSAEDHLNLMERWVKEDTPERRKDRPSLHALINYGIDFRQGQDLYFLNNHNTFDPKGRFITIDITHVPEEYQDAVTVLMVNIISARLKTPDADTYKKKPRTIISVDEGPRVLSNPGMAKFAPIMFREARSGKCSVAINGQDLKGMKDILPVLKSNTDAIIFMCSMEPDDVDEFATEFKFSEREKLGLQQKGKGKFLFYKTGRKIFGRVIPSNIQNKVFFNEESESEEVVSVEDLSKTRYEVLPEVKEIVKEFGVIPYNWITELNDTEMPGYTRYTKVYPVTNNLNKVNFVRNDILADIEVKGTHCGESIDHWITKVQMGGERIRRGCNDVIINTWGDQGGEEDPDVTGITPSGKRFGDEYAHPGSRNIGRLRDQMNKHKLYCDEWVCVCQSSNESTVAAAVGNKDNGEPNYRTRGDGYTKYLDSFVIDEPETDIKKELKKAEEYELNIGYEKSSSSSVEGERGTNPNLEVCGSPVENGTITEGVCE